tara:strand:+ start:36757 stop:36945 length:189 start_codon:yes stop_codon:yes gene_type:complete
MCCKIVLMVYPVYCNDSKKFKIEISKNDVKEVRFHKELTKDEINDALIKTYIYKSNTILKNV